MYGKLYHIIEIIGNVVHISTALLRPNDTLRQQSRKNVFQKQPDITHSYIVTRRVRKYDALAYIDKYRHIRIVTKL